MADARDASLLFCDRVRGQANRNLNISISGIAGLCLIQTADEELLPGEFIIVPVLFSWHGPVPASPAIHILIVSGIIHIPYRSCLN
jgi:hypothetical protein